MQTRWNSHLRPKYYPEPFNYPLCFPLSSFRLPFLPAVWVLSLRSSDCSLEITRAIVMLCGQKALKYKGQRVQHSSAPLPMRTVTITHPHKRPSKIHTRTQTDERWVQRRWEQVPLVYFLCVPNVGPGGAPQLNHSRHAVEWEATTLTSLKGAIDTRYSTHTHTHTCHITMQMCTNKYTRTHVRQVPGQHC